MPYRLPFPTIPRRMGVFLLCAFLLCPPAGCGGMRPSGGDSDSGNTSSGQTGSVRIDTGAPYAACVAMCSENTSLALVTRTGCLDGCAEARRAFPLAGATFSSGQDCLDILLQQESAKQYRIREMRSYCDAKWTHMHNRKGCYNAADSFYANLDHMGMCGSDGTTASAFGGSSAQPRKTAPAIPDAPGQPVPAAPEMPSAIPAPSEQPPSPTTNITQPAGPLIPPPYVMDPQPEAMMAVPPASLTPGADTADPPAIHDTPKYQRPAPQTSRLTPVPGVLPASASPTQPPVQAPVQAPEQTSGQPPVQTPAQASGQTALSGTSAPADTPPAAHDPEPAQPVERAPAQPAPAISAPEQEPVPAAPPGQPGTAPEPTPVQPEPVTPLVPAPEQPALQPSVRQPLRNPAEQETLSGPPIPGLNANRPVPPESEPAQSSSTAVLPPVPSMLNRPYTPPAIITPQIEVPPEGTETP